MLKAFILGELFGLYLLVLGARLLLINICGSDIPYWDQWYAEAEQLYIPWLDGTLNWHNFLHPHNEHRIISTRIYAFLILITSCRLKPVFSLIEQACIVFILTGGYLISRNIISNKSNIEGVNK